MTTPKREDAKLASTVHISHYELADRPQPPSETFRYHEALLIAELARTAHLDRRRFVDWPEITVAGADYRGFPEPYVHLQARVVARSL